MRGSCSTRLMLDNITQPGEQVAVSVSLTYTSETSLVVVYNTVVVLGMLRFASIIDRYTHDHTRIHRTHSLDLDRIGSYMILIMMKTMWPIVICSIDDTTSLISLQQSYPSCSTVNSINLDAPSIVLVGMCLSRFESSPHFSNEQR